MAEKEEGFVWHAFHNVLLSYMHGCDYHYRVNTIKRKPPNEIPMRLERFQFVKGELPDAFNDVQINDYASHWEAVQKLFETHKDAVEKLHAEECKGCTWNGKEMIFTNWFLRIKLVALWIKNALRRTK